MVGIRNRRRPTRRITDASRALEQARREARLTYTELGRALSMHPRTFRRWELGEAEPRERQWQRVLALYAQRAPAVAKTLAASVGRPAPAIAHAPDPHLAGRIIAAAADEIDVAPKRVREVLRAVVHASTEAGVAFDVFARMVAAEADHP